MLASLAACISAGWASPLLLVGRDAIETWHGSDDEYREVSSVYECIHFTWPYDANIGAVHGPRSLTHSGSPGLGM